MVEPTPEPVAGGELTPVQRFMADPTCLCGCGAALPTAKKPEKMSLYKPGHDAALKSQLLKVTKGQLPASSINPAVFVMKPYIKFLATRPELASALQ